jgi:hypothetical protein
MGAIVDRQEKGMYAEPDSCQCKDPKDDERRRATVERHRMGRQELVDRSGE